MKLRLILLLAALLLGVGGSFMTTGIALAQNTTSAGMISLESDYLMNSIAGAHRINLQGVLGGEMDLKLDGNACQVDAHGDPTTCTLRMYNPLRINSKKLGDPHNSADPGRQAYGFISRSWHSMASALGIDW